MEYTPRLSTDREYIEMGRSLREAMAEPSAPPPSPSEGGASIYPPNEQAHSTRLRSINQMISELETIMEERERLVKRYKKFRSGVHVVDHTCTALAVGSTAAGLAVLTTIVGAPIAVGIQSVGLGFGCGTILAKYVWNRLSLKIKKHQKIVEVCQSTIQDIRAATSKALSSGHITDSQYREVIELRRKFDQMKKIIQQEAGAKMSELEKQNAWMEQGRKEVLKDIQKSSLFQRTFSRRSRNFDSA